jgi:alpha 1,2-mannosyltransferase
MTEQKEDILERFHAALEECPGYRSGRFQGRGIVICAGGQILATNAYISLRRLRYLCKLPVEIVFSGDEFPQALQDEWSQEFSDLTFRDLSQSPEIERPGGMTASSYRGFPIKPYAVAWSAFSQVLLLDADNFAISDPAVLFEQAEYKDHGALFWPDIDESRFTKDEFFTTFGLDASRNSAESEFESGQMVVDKERCWKALMATCLLNSDSFRPVVYSLTYGDKDTFRLGFQFVGKRYGSVPQIPVEFGSLYFTQKVPFTKHSFHLPHTSGEYRRIGLVQHAPEGSTLFTHRTTRPWCPYSSLVARPRLPVSTPEMEKVLLWWDEFDHSSLREFQQRCRPLLPFSWRRWRIACFTAVGVSLLNLWLAFLGLFAKS